MTQLPGVQNSVQHKTERQNIVKQCDQQIELKPLPGNKSAEDAFGNPNRERSDVDRLSNSLKLSEVRVIIVDDEYISRHRLRMAIRMYPNWKVERECSCVSEAKTALMELPDIDAVFLDVQMPGESGLSLLQEMSNRSQKPLVVLITAHSQYAINAFDFQAFDYLLKPFDFARVATTVGRIERQLAAKMPANQMSPIESSDRLEIASQTPYPEWLLLRSLNGTERVNVSDLIWVFTSSNYLELHLQGRVVLYRSTFKELASMLDPKLFVQVHRCAMVKKSKFRALLVQGTRRYKLRLSNGDLVPVSHRYVCRVKDVLNSPVDVPTSRIGIH